MIVIGGGAVGTRKALAFADAGARVSVIAPSISELLSADERIAGERRSYRGKSDIQDFDIVVAATDSRELNERIANDAMSLHRLVNIASDGTLGTFNSMAVHRAGRLTVGVSAGGVPTAAMRIRDAIAERFDGRYERVIDNLSNVRNAGGDWISANDAVDSEFCSRVERGEFDGASS